MQLENDNIKFVSVSEKNHNEPEVLVSKDSDQVGLLKKFEDSEREEPCMMEAKKKNKKKSKQKNTLAELLPGPSPPPPVSTSATSVVAQNPFDDPMPTNSLQSMHNTQPSMTPSQSGPMPPVMQHGGGMNPLSKVYPPNQPMVFNPSNPSAPPIYPCGICHKEVHENDQAVLCESGCNFWFHRICTGLTHDAFTMLKVEVYAEWVCDRCLNTKNIPLVKLKP